MLAESAFEVACNLLSLLYGSAGSELRHFGEDTGLAGSHRATEQDDGFSSLLIVPELAHGALKLGLLLHLRCKLQYFN